MVGALMKDVDADRSFLSAFFVAVLSLLIAVKCVNGCADTLRKFYRQQISRR
jgi:hypothetical protein